MSEIEEVKDLVTSKARENGIDPKFLHALVMTESNYDQWIVRYEQDYRWLYKIEECASLTRTTVSTEKIMQQTSWGLCQIMGAIAREYGFQVQIPYLLSPGVNLSYAIIHLKKKIKQYSLNSFADIYAAYNAGSVRKKNNEYVNKKNVDRFLINLNKVS